MPAALVIYVGSYSAVMECYSVAQISLLRRYENLGVAQTFLHLVLVALLFVSTGTSDDCT